MSIFPVTLSAPSTFNLLFIGASLPFLRSWKYSIYFQSPFHRSAIYNLKGSYFIYLLSISFSSELDIVRSRVADAAMPFNLLFIGAHVYLSALLAGGTVFFQSPFHRSSELKEYELPVNKIFQSPFHRSTVHVHGIYIERKSTFNLLFIGAS